VRVAFDDLYGEDIGGHSAGNLLDGARAILSRVRARRIHMPMRVVGTWSDPTHRTFEAGGVSYRVIGDDDTGLPVFERLRSRFADVTSRPKHVRVDTPGSYALFRAARDPNVLQLEQRLAALEAALASHTADGHDGGRIARLEDELHQHLVETVRGTASSKIPLPLPSWAQGKIECWQDGPEILCSIRVRGCDDEPRIVTSAAPLEGCLGEILGCAIEADVEPEHILAAGPPLAQVLGASALLRQLCGAVPELRKRAGAGTYVGVLAPAGDPDVAATMALLQRCQLGDPRARIELLSLSQQRGALVADAADRLARGQREKRRPS